jgi:hypothetical protein
MPLSSEFQRCLLAPREVDFELKSFRLTAPPLPNLKSNTEPFEVALTVSVETESWSAIPPKRRSSCILSSACQLPGVAEIPDFETKGLSFHIENTDGSSLSRYKKFKIFFATRFEVIVKHISGVKVSSNYVRQIRLLSVQKELIQFSS